MNERPNKSGVTTGKRGKREIGEEERETRGEGILLLFNIFIIS
jgi:hypothetical protein